MSDDSGTRCNVVCSHNNGETKRAFVILNREDLSDDEALAKYLGMANDVVKLGYVTNYYHRGLSEGVLDTPGLIDFVNALSIADGADVWYFAKGWEDSPTCVAFHEIARALRIETLEEVSASTPAV